MAKGNLSTALGGGAQTGSGQYRPSALRQPGSTMAKGNSGGASVSIKGGTDLLSSLKSIMADLDSQPNNGNQSDANSRYGGNLMMPNYYSNFTNPSLMNPFASWSSYSPYGTGGYSNFANQPKGNAVQPPPAAPAGPKWATGNDALNHINSQLTRGLAADEIDYIKKNVGYNDGGVDEPMMSSIMNLIRQNKPELLR